ncbi:hypothetical protein GCM10011297_32390 [Bacterioplanes sanyensis]|uniref:EAL domain-containing protein n=1 Tax=Bacterioplanes sanyensis TaxID=1249553 RepID=UPI001675B131|nr:GGDEF domain-containing phosphodiesterase [Bacterioplanes sanyensis]GGY57166.1 hypothetical protein GCM10011297_32390 [Bacterioplanes sanyensis]
MLTETAQPVKTSAQLPLIALMPVALIAMAEVSRLFSINGLAISAIWPVTAWLCACWLNGYRLAFLLQIPALFAWCYGWQDYSVAIAAGVTVSTSTGAWLAASGLNRLTRIPTQGASSVRQLSAFYGLAVLAATALVALGGSLSLILGAPDYQDFLLIDVWLSYWAFEALGMLLFLPLLWPLLASPARFVRQLNADFAPLAMRIWLGLLILLIGSTLSFDLLQNATYASVAMLVYFPLFFWFFLRAAVSSSTLMIAVTVIGLIVCLINGWAGLQAISSVQGLLDTIALAILVTLAAQLVNVMAQERNRLLKHFRRQTVTDSLTRLGNDRALRQQLDALLKKQQHAYLAYFRMMDTGPLTDLFGLDAMHLLEQELGSGLNQQLPANSPCFRLSEGDFAALLISEPHQAEDILTQLRQLHLRLEQQAFAVAERPVRLRLALGLVRIDGQLDDASQYQQAAAQVAYQASQQPRRWQQLDDTAELINQQRSNAKVFNQVRQALRDNRLLLYAQPIQPVQRPAQGLYFEVLLRMAGDDGGVISPGVFLPVAEQSGLMADIDRWVIRHTLLQLQPELVACCSINLSGASLSAPDTLSFIRLSIEQSLVRPQQLRFEITETEQIVDLHAATELVKGLRQLGCSVALDDFGTGLASYAYLKQFAFDCIKIDGQFVRDIRTSAADQAIVSSICQVARQQQLAVVAEFVEDESSIQLLSDLGVDFLQGYAIGHPQPLTPWLAGAY